MALLDFIKNSGNKSSQSVGGDKPFVQVPVQSTPPSHSVNQDRIAIPMSKVDSSVKTVPVLNKVNQSQPAAPVLPMRKTVINKPLKQISSEDKIDLMTHLTQRSNKVLMVARDKAQELNNPLVDSEHLLYGLLSDSGIYRLLNEVKISPQVIKEQLVKNYRRQSNQLTKPPEISPRVKRILLNSLTLGRKQGFEFVSPDHILLALFDEGEGMGARVLAGVGLKREMIIKKMSGDRKILEGEGKEEKKKKQTPEAILNQFTIDLTDKAAKGELDPVVERSKEIERVIHILSRRRKNNPVLIGEAGVGKTAIVEGLAQEIVSKRVPETLFDKKILSLDLMSVLAGASHRGEFEERMKKIIEVIKASQGKIILFIDELHNIVGAGSSGEGSLDASNFLKPALSRGEVQVIGSTTTEEYRKYIEKDAALERRFQPVVVPEPTVEQAIKMLLAIRDKYEAFHRVKIPDSAVEAAVILSKRYVGDRFLPDKAVDLIDEAASAVRLPLISLPEEINSLKKRIKELQQELAETEKGGDEVKARRLRSQIKEHEDRLREKEESYAQKKSQATGKVSEEIIKDIIARWTGIPISKIGKSETDKLANLEDAIHKRLIDQEEAVKLISDAVRRGRAGLKSIKRPIGSFVFLGPTGVGKTELAKTLAEILFGQEEAMIRFDMTEYMEKHEVAKLLGAPPGYVGYEEGGKLTEAVRRHPYSVILFDEIEKAHPDIFNILLQILDDGRLTDNKGHTVSFKNTVIICTSNIGTKIIQEKILKKGQPLIEEPAVLSTYVFTPTGRIILTIGQKYFEKDVGVNSSWQEKGPLLNYFAGQKISGDGKFPVGNFDSHAISFQGREYITIGDSLLTRNLTTDKIWQKKSLIDYFNNNVVVNALPDTPDEQLPTVRLKTHAFSPDGKEIITFGGRFWQRKDRDNNWETGSLVDYFGKTVVDHDQEKAILPISYWDIHFFSPKGDEAIIVSKNIWVKNKGELVWKKYLLADYFGADFPLKKEVEEKKIIEAKGEKKKYQLVKNEVMDELGKFFRPELINRFDEIIIFQPLRYEDMAAIATLQFKGLAKLLDDQDIGFSFTKEAVKEIVRVGFDPVYGARPLRRAIQRKIENPISNLIIKKSLKEGDTLLLDSDGTGFLFKVHAEEKIGKIDKDMGKKEEFICQNCNLKFETEIVPNSTVICSHCGSTKVVQSNYGK